MQSNTTLIALCLVGIAYCSITCCTAAPVSEDSIRAVRLLGSVRRTLSRVVQNNSRINSAVEEYACTSDERTEVEYVCAHFAFLQMVVATRKAGAISVCDYEASNMERYYCNAKEIFCRI